MYCGPEGLDVNGKYKHDKRCKCPTCIQTNSDKVHIGNVRKYVDDVTQIGQQVVTDLCGPFADSVEGYRYVISFTDVYSRFSASISSEERVMQNRHWSLSLLSLRKKGLW